MLWRRWLFLVLGGALFTPCAIFGLVVVPLSVPSLASSSDAVFVAVTATAALLALVATSQLPLVRTLEGAVAPRLLGGPAGDLVVGPARTVGERRRTGGWFLVHAVVGAAVSLASVFTPAVVVSVVASWTQGDAQIALGQVQRTIPQLWAPVLAISLPLALAVVVAAAGAAAARSAPWLLGPDPAARLLALEQRTAELTERTRLARELHDSIGHALTVTTLQAGAARAVLHSDPAFVEQALVAIEQTGRIAATDLDDFLGLLREDLGVRAPQATLRDLDALLASHREAGLPVTLVVEGDLAAVPAVISREVYRIVQEGLTNVHRHAGAVPTEVVLALDEARLTTLVRNPAGEGPRPRARRGGHGLAGIRERVRLLGGRVEAGPEGGSESRSWRLLVVVPTGGRR